jgi:hypothetical protein
MLAECALVHIISLPLCPVHWRITPPHYIGDFQILGVVCKSLRLSWPKFTITNALTERTVAIKNNLKLSQYEAWKIGRMFNQPYTTYVIVVHHGHMSVLPWSPGSTKDDVRNSELSTLKTID